MEFFSYIIPKLSEFIQMKCQSSNNFFIYGFYIRMCIWSCICLKIKVIQSTYRSLCSCPLLNHSIFRQLSLICGNDRNSMRTPGSVILCPHYGHCSGRIMLRIIQSNSSQIFIRDSLLLSC